MNNHSVVFLDALCRDYDRKKAKEAELTRRREMLMIESPFFECWVDVRVGGFREILKFSNTLYWADHDFVDRQIELAKKRLEALQDG